MHNANVAEWILSLVTTRERAAATVGDLIESRVGALRFWGTIGSQFVRRAATPAVVVFLAQFFLFFWAGFALRFSVYLLIRPFTLLRWIIDLTLLATQILVGYGIARYGKTRAPGICLLVVLADCLLGARNLNNGNINMAVWAIPLLASARFASRSRSGRAEPPVLPLSSTR